MAPSRGCTRQHTDPEVQLPARRGDLTSEGRLPLRRARGTRPLCRQAALQVKDLLVPADGLLERCGHTPSVVGAYGGYRERGWRGLG
jgi:hypothetical protein